MKRILLLLCLGASTFLTAQVTTEIGGDYIQLPYNILDDIPAPAIGTMVYDPDKKGTYIFTHDDWQRISENQWNNNSVGINYNDNVAIGLPKAQLNSTDPISKLFVRGNEADNIDAIRVQVDGGTEFRVFANKAIALGSNWNSPQANALFLGATRTIVNDTLKMNGGRIELTEQGTMSFYNGSNETIRMTSNLNGDGRISTDELEIMGGSDLAEYFDVSSSLENESIIPGKIVSVKGTEGKLELSTSKRDKKVVGVISGANGVKPGMYMGQKGSIADGDYPVALTGRTYVYATAENGAIEAGDFLTSSSKPGYAMKVKRMKKAQGAIVGKALTSLSEGEGFVLVLVNLQ